MDAVIIVEIDSDLPTFKRVEFRPGLNILLADRHADASDTETLNGSGKSSLVEIVHFLLGANADKGSLLRDPALEGYEFRGRFMFGEVEVEVRRRGSNPRKIVVSPHPGTLGMTWQSDGGDGGHTVALDEWRRWLGDRVFGLRVGQDPAMSLPHAPTFRSLFGYFARRREDGGFLDAARFSKRQSDLDARVALSYLFGLDWRIAREFDDVSRAEAEVKVLKRRFAQRHPGSARSLASLRADLAVAKAKAAEATRRVSGFVVLDQYGDLAAEAGRLKKELETLAKDASILETKVRHLLETTSDSHRPAPEQDVAAMYEMAGVQLPMQALRSFEDVRAFHASVVANRRRHLEVAVAEATEGLKRLRGEIADRERRRSEILASLSGRGAFSDLVEQQRILASRISEANRLEEEFRDRQQLELEGGDSKIERERLRLRLLADFNDRWLVLDEAALAVSEAKEALYSERDGHLEVEATTRGPEFDISIEGDRSGGIANMEIFCMDHALATVTKPRHGGPGFLIHDSHLFDGVDPRQAATAIVVGGRTAAALGTQYIALMNVDQFSTLAFQEEDDPTAAILPVKLSDTEEGGLFGFKFA
ncbi:DUF2326 domain-containing protein [Aureimonas sp. SK2]|uniref:DUF2326 domain-containing protein n=1 Tax=Aureimonas sp. SK2 TaxID=3015992 RepID=UPI002444DA31|nr:DUF2326 domain-containing protein [Aureimonas sp. SK2]